MLAPLRVAALALCFAGGVAGQTSWTALYNLTGQKVLSSATYNVTYSTVTGYFLQDDPSTNASAFNFITTNFGLINQTYHPTPKNKTRNTQWERFAHRVQQLNLNAPPDVRYKVVFFGRHGEGYHNAAESYYGTPAWNCYWAELNGNSTNAWNDARLTPNGVGQAQNASAAFAHLFTVQKAPYFESYYTSPLTRCLQTANVTFSTLDLPTSHAFAPTVKELFREGVSLHTCDRRSSRGYILDNYPAYTVEPNFPELDELWTGVVGETSAGQDARSRRVLDDVFTTDPATWISVTSHSGEIGSLLRVLGHQPFSLNTGSVIPVLVRAEVRQLTGGQPGVYPTMPIPQPTPTATWTVSPTCTAPPLTSVSTGCVCAGGATPVP